MQVMGSTIEADLLRAEQAGLAIYEIEGLENTLARAAAQDPVVERILIVSPIGKLILSSDGRGLSEIDKDAVLRRVLSAGENETALSRTDWLYSGRRLLDSSGQMMAAIILTTPTAVFMPDVLHVFDELRAVYLVVFSLVALAIVPVVLIQFRRANSIYSLLASVPLRGKLPPLSSDRDATELQAQICAGNRVIDELEGCT